MDDNPPGAGWHVLDELMLPASADVNATLMDWLAQAVAPFQFQAEFSTRLADSAQEAVEHVTGQLAAAGRLRILIPSGPKQVASVQNWGFFHLEKTNTLSEQGSALEHIIELYLYPEG